MSITWMIYLCVAAALAYGLVAGVFLTFSDFIMRSLRTVAPAAGMAAMQAINRKVYGSLFLMMFMALAAVSVALAGNAVIFATGPAVAWIVGGGAVYLIGAVPLTIFYWKNGILNPGNVWLSVAACVPVMIGTIIGESLRKYVNEALFRKILLIALFVMGLNMLRRALF